VSRPVALVHVGLMKTGTTYLQQLAIANREVLADQGVHFAGATWSRQVRAAQDLLDLDQHDPQVQALSAGAWDELVAEIRGRREGATLVSMEFLSFARRRALARVARDLHDVEVHVIVTVRDMTATIPAQWQTSVTSRRTHTWSEFQRGVQHSDGPLWAARALLGDTGVREFRRTQDVGRVLRVWGRLAPPERLTVVTVPLRRTEPDLLWRRFAEALGVDPAVPVEAPDETNPSLGFASAELVRRLNVALEGVLPWDYNRTVKAPLASRMLSARRGEERRPRLDGATAAFARDWNRRSRAAVAASGARVVGTLADLPVDPPAPDAAEPGELAPAELLAAARDAWRGLNNLVERRRRRVSKLLGAERPTPLGTEEPGWFDGDSAGDVDRAVTDLAGLTRTAIQLRRDVQELSESRDEAARR